MMFRCCFVPALIALAVTPLACGGGVERRATASAAAAEPPSDAKQKSELAVLLPSQALVRRLMKETGAGAETVLQAIYPVRDKLNEQGELSDKDEDAVRVELTKMDARVADDLARLHRNALLDMERYIQARTRGDCDGVSDNYGYKTETPLQIGAAAAGDRLFMGALICPNNRLSKVVARVQTEIGNYERPNRDQGDMPLDSWNVNCGAKDYTFYSDLYTRGRFCAPRGFEIAPLRAVEAYSLSWSAFKKDKYEDALTLANEAIQKGGPVADFLEHRAFVEMKLGRTQAARSSFRSALKASPNHEGIVVNWAGFEFKHGTPKQADKALTQALQTVADDHKHYRSAWCMAAEIKSKLRSPRAQKRGQEMAEQGCAAQDDGSEHCCELNAGKPK